jgi:gas vesicle protein
LCALAGAAAGAAVGYLFFTDEGRQLRRDLEPRLLDLMTELEKARGMMDPARPTRADVRPFGR